MRWIVVASEKELESDRGDLLGYRTTVWSTLGVKDQARVSKWQAKRTFQ